LESGKKRIKTKCCDGFLKVVCVTILWHAAPVNADVECGVVSIPDATNSELWNNADCHSRQGEHANSLLALEELQRRTGRNDSVSTDDSLLLTGRLGAAYLSVGDYQRAQEILEAGARDAERDSLSEKVAPLLNDLGRVYVTLDEPLRAIATFDNALRLASANDDLLRASIASNLTRTLIDLGFGDGVGERLSELQGYVDRVPDPFAQTRLQLTVGLLYRDAQVELDGPANWRRESFDAFSAALANALELQQPIMQSYALGHIGSLYEDERRFESALQYSRQAALLAQQSSSDASLYLWQWQVARILYAQGLIDEAIDAYRLATETLANVRLEVSERSPTSFEKDVSPLYFEYADRLLSRTSELDSASERQSNLVAVRDALEQLKVAEVEDYYEDECAVNENAAHLEQISASAAILYPVVLNDRVELLLSLPDGMSQITSPVSGEAIERAARQLRVTLEDPQSGDDYRIFAETLYDWLIRPIDSALVRSSVETLVIVPGGSLRTIPLAVLHDGQNFLIERYSIVTSPGLTLTGRSSSLPASESYVQINGMTKAVGEFPALPHVANEIQSIAALYDADVNRDDTFLASKVEADLAERQYSFVHIATHGQFHRDPRRSFLLANDERITMDRLEGILGLRQYVSEPIDLLFLSACQTAAGDDRAALGLAGVAARSGAESVVATLWLINDESTATLVSEFYRALQQKDGNKAEALQQAQLMLLENERYSHPNYWAPFLLVGDWL